MTRPARFAAGFALALAGALLLQGCATQGATTVSDERVRELNAALASGNLRLNCGTSCAGSWGIARSRAKGLHENRLWNDLAMEVSRVGYQSELTYYYLARAAEGLGHTEAAVTYYRLSLAQPQKCAGALNVCDGTDLPYATLAALDRIAGADPKKGGMPSR